MVAANCFKTRTARNYIMRCFEMEVNLALRFGTARNENTVVSTNTTYQESDRV